MFAVLFNILFSAILFICNIYTFTFQLNVSLKFTAFQLQLTSSIVYFLKMLFIPALFLAGIEV